MVGLGLLPQNGQTAWKFGSLSLFWDPLRPLRDCNVSEGVEHGRCQGLTFGERMVFQNLRTSWEIRRYPTWFPKSNKRSRLRPKFEVQIPPSFPQNARWNQNHLYFYRSNHKKDCSDQVQPNLTTSLNLIAIVFFHSLGRLLRHISGPTAIRRRNPSRTLNLGRKQGFGHLDSNCFWYMTSPNPWSSKHSSELCSFCSYHSFTSLNVFVWNHVDLRLEFDHPEEHHRTAPAIARSRPGPSPTTPLVASRINAQFRVKPFGTDDCALVCSPTRKLWFEFLTAVGPTVGNIFLEQRESPAWIPWIPHRTCSLLDENHGKNPSRWSHWSSLEKRLGTHDAFRSLTKSIESPNAPCTGCSKLQTCHCPLWAQSC